MKTESSENDESNLSKSDLFSDETIAAHLEKVSIELEAAKNKSANNLRAALETIQNRLTELKKQSPPVEKLEKVLEKLDALIDETLLENYETENLKIEIEKQTASYKNKMETEVYRRTFDLMLLKRLREQAEVPRLSLFYL